MAQQTQEKKTAELEVYMVSVEIISGHKLPKKDIAGKSDPYCIVKILDHEYKTKTIKNTLDPVWNENFSYNFFRNPKTVKFEVFDADSSSSDDAIGIAEFTLKQFFKTTNKKKPFNGNIKLKNCKQGTIKVKIYGEKILPLKLKELNKKQENLINEKNNILQNLQTENKVLKENKIEKVKEPGSGSSDKDKDKEVPTKRHKLPKLPKLPKISDIKINKSVIIESIKNIIFKLLNYWYYILKTWIYTIPFIGGYVELMIILLGSILRLGEGGAVYNGALKSKRPIKCIKLYEYEGNIECKKVREIMTSLDLDYECYPCPIPLSSSFESRYRDEVRQKGGKELLPMYLDENFGDDGPVIIYGSNNIIRFIMQHYGNNVKLSRFDKLRIYISNNKYMIMIYKLYQTLLRGLPENGISTIGQTNKPNELLELYSYESSPFCIKVREILSSLELPYKVKNIARGSKKKRKKFESEYGTKYSNWRKQLNLIQVPMLIDPNTEKENPMFESEDIKKYLINTYRN